MMLFKHSLTEGRHTFTLLEAPSRAQHLIRMMEMSRIDMYAGYLVYVYLENQRNPSFHVAYKNDWEVVLQIKDFAVLEKKTSEFPKGSQLPNSILKELRKLFMLPANSRETNWEFLITVWNKNNPAIQLPEALPMP